jgi:hypothetical protein
MFLFSLKSIKLFLLLILPLLINIQTSDAVDDKYVSAIVYTKWSETPIALEARYVFYCSFKYNANCFAFESEFIFKHNQNSFWNYAYEISSINSDDFNLASSDATQTAYENVLKISRKYLSEIEFDLLKLSLSIRAHSPAIEASRKVYMLLINHV